MRNKIEQFNLVNLAGINRATTMKQLENVRTEMSLKVLAYNLRRMINIDGIAELINIMEEIAISKLQALVSRFQRLKSRAVITGKSNFWKLSLGTRQLSTI